MKKYLKIIITFLLPILQGAFIKAAADELTKLAYPERKRGYTGAYRAPRPGSINYRIAENRFAASGPIPKQRQPLEKYHDVLMVAFDITGPSQIAVHAFLEEIMSRTVHSTEKFGANNGIDIDSAWIADDDAPSDCDSAVFVKKGSQGAARAFLNANDLSN